MLAPPVEVPMPRRRVRSRLIAGLAALGAVGAAMAVGQTAPPPLPESPAPAVHSPGGKSATTARVLREHAGESLLYSFDAHSHLSRLAAMAAEPATENTDRPWSLSLSHSPATPHDVRADGAVVTSGTPVSFALPHRLEHPLVNRSVVVDARDGAPRRGS